jgi:hypothetical protein
MAVWRRSRQYARRTLMRMSDKPRRSVSVGRAATVDDLKAGWELAHEIMHFGSFVNPRHHWIEESTATYVEPITRAVPGHSYRRARCGTRCCGMPWRLNPVISCKGQSPFCRAFQGCIKSLGLSFAGRRVTAHLLEPPCTDPCARRLSGVSGQPLLPMPIN